MVDVDDSCQFSADSQPKSIGLVWVLAATRRSIYIHQINRVNSRNDFCHDDSTTSYGSSSSSSYYYYYKHGYCEVSTPARAVNTDDPCSWHVYGLGTRQPGQSIREQGPCMDPSRHFPYDMTRN